MEKDEPDIVNKLNKQIEQMNEYTDCIIRQRDSVIDQSLIIRQERESMIEKNRELQERLRIIQGELDKYKQLEQNNIYLSSSSSM